MNYTEFTCLMTKLRSCYQNAITDAEMWLASIASYWGEIKDRDPESIRRAFDGAWRQHPVWMPSLGQMMELITMYEHSRAVAKSHRLTEGEAFSDPDAPEKVRKIVTLLSRDKILDVEEYREIVGETSPPQQQEGES